jgi:hypothetical protein
MLYYLKVGKLDSDINIVQQKWNTMRYGVQTGHKYRWQDPRGEDEESET